MGRVGDPPSAGHRHCCLWILNKFCLICFPEERRGRKSKENSSKDPFTHSRGAITRGLSSTATRVASLPLGPWPELARGFRRRRTQGLLFGCHLPAHVQPSMVPRRERQPSRRRHTMPRAVDTCCLALSRETCLQSLGPFSWLVWRWGQDGVSPGTPPKGGSMTQQTRGESAAGKPSFAWNRGRWGRDTTAPRSASQHERGTRRRGSPMSSSIETTHRAASLGSAVLPASVSGVSGTLRWM